MEDLNIGPMLVFSMKEIEQYVYLITKPGDIVHVFVI